MNTSDHQVYLAGIGTYLGSDRLNVDDLLKDWTDEDLRDPSSLVTKLMTRKNVKKRAGTDILYRFSEDETLEQVSAVAIKRALSHSGFCLGDINGIYFSTASPTTKLAMPTPESIIGNILGLENIIAVPVGSGCTGALIALKSAYNQLIVDNLNEREAVYVIGCGDRTSKVIDKKSSILFSEGAAALVLTNKLVRNGYSISEPFIRGLVDSNELGVDAMTIDNDTRIYSMNGGRVFSFVVNHAFPLIKTGLNLDELEKKGKDFYVVPHNASGKIVKTIASGLDVPKERVYTEDVLEIGNLTVASWPVAFYNSLKKARIRQDQIVVPITFGAGNNVGGFIASPLGNPGLILGI